MTVHLMALASALCSAAATIWIRQGLHGSNAYSGFWINVAVGALGLWAAVFLLAPRATLQLQAVPFFVVSGLLGTVTGRLLRFVSIDKVGAPVAASIINLNPFISVALAIVLLGERVTWPIVVGTVVIVLGTTFLSLSGKHVGFRARHLWYPLVSASCFGVVAIIRKLGLSQTGPLFGSAVNTTTALLAFTAFLLVSGNRQAFVCERRNWGYFIAAGVAENAGVFLGIMALSLGEVSVVMPLSGTAPLFVLVMTAVWLRGRETVHWRVVLGATLMVLGIVCITA